ncbi:MULTISPECIES: hypothetical protein [unclassified Bacillus (in: firmicutes)]|uniref:hypothetical protein n=1 Tax=unclassified Bacillus (in: firmicutes) TaxID=185979 RepID=UPI000409B2AA|nr:MULTISPECIES: hypothetical protein [unclassified Bacillus (in: firmicutes)]QHZ48820.1 hypothetical protein M654_022545 [Bacillus sp. NSP9.1]WFA05539.1 hypothetical protein P3X63_01355 [Bacillus sp. HSf4]
MEFSEGLKNKIMDIIQKRGLLKPCENCKHDEMVMIEPFARLDLQDDSSVLSVGAEAIPSIAIVCTNCGKMNLYAAKVLLPSEFH